ncbi:MAG TPA: hypothetical protein VL625_03625 [Patescibacteria group bacterium]|nr:hypothetical protein [Patescibacteria group bacterium]
MKTLFIILFSAFIGSIAAKRLLHKPSQEKTKMGINTKPVRECPKCGNRFPIVRIPADAEEALYGGNTCRKCGFKIDKWGKERIERKDTGTA